MRQQVDLAILHQAINRPWFEPVVATFRPSLSRIFVHDLDWEASGEFAAEPSLNMDVDLCSDLLYRAAVRLRRYDALMVPVSLHTLAWTRQLLSSVPRGPSIPLIGVLHQVQCGGMIDLLELGMIDFVQTPVQPQELRARVLCAISRAPMRVALRDAIGQRVAKEQPAGKGSPMRMARTIEGCSKSFAQAKSEVITAFESQYVRDALALTHGNVARAAAASGKNRRAFWEIMRKHQIDAAEFRRSPAPELAGNPLGARVHR